MEGKGKGRSEDTPGLPLQNTSSLTELPPPFWPGPVHLPGGCSHGGLTQSPCLRHSIHLCTGIREEPLGSHSYLPPCAGVCLEGSCSYVLTCLSSSSVLSNTHPPATYFVVVCVLSKIKCFLDSMVGFSHCQSCFWLYFIHRSEVDWIINSEVHVTRD